MKSILLSQFNFDEDWIYDSIKRHITGEEKVAVCPLAFSPVFIKDNEDWTKAYNHGCRYYEEIMLPLRKFGFVGKKEFGVIWLNYFKDSREVFKEKINEADILILPGGLPDFQMKRMKELDIIKTICEYKGLVIGKSSGTLTQTPWFYLSPDSDYPKLQFGEGIGRIDAECYFEVHFDPENEEQVKALREAQKEKYRKVIAIGDKGGLIIEDENIAEYGDVYIYED
jgi:hypothetical protein